MALVARAQPAPRKQSPIPSAPEPFTTAAHILDAVAQLRTPKCAVPRVTERAALGLDTGGSE